MSFIKNYDNFLLSATDLDVAKDFYGEKLGLKLKFDFSAKGMVAFNVGDNEPAIILHKQEPVKPAIWLTVEDVNVAYEALKLKGVQFLSEPFEIMTGLVVEFTDPFGNKFALTDYSKMPDKA